MAPVVSVIIPTYNRAATLAESLDSALAQRFLDLEIIVVDDGSIDDTEAVLARYGGALRVLRRDHRGVAAARNAALAAAGGDYVAFHDSDDVVLADRLVVQHGHLAAHPDLGAVICNGWLDPARTKPWIQPRLARRLEAAGVGLTELFEHSLAQMQAMLFRRPAIEAVGGFDESLRLLSDLDFILRFGLEWRAGFLDVPVFAYHQRADSLTADRRAVREQSLVILERFVDRHPEAIARLGASRIQHKRAHRYY